MKSMKTSKKIVIPKKFHPFLLAAAAIFAGLVNGFLGTGGGIVLMFALSMLPESERPEPRDRFATLIAVILPLSLLSLISYKDVITPALCGEYLLPGILGGFAGALLLDKISVGAIKKLFAFMVIYAGYSFLRG